jgi:hypothetical protein
VIKQSFVDRVPELKVKMINVTVATSHVLQVRSSLSEHFQTFRLCFSYFCRLYFTFSRLQKFLEANSLPYRSFKTCCLLSQNSPSMAPFSFLFLDNLANPQWVGNQHAVCHSLFTSLVTSLFFLPCSYLFLHLPPSIRLQVLGEQKPLHHTQRVGLCAW